MHMDPAVEHAPGTPTFARPRARAALQPVNGYGLALCPEKNQQRTSGETGMPASKPCASRVRAPAHCTQRYRARKPENTPLYQVAKHHFETRLALKRAGEAWEDMVPAFVERDFRKYLQCGHFCHGKLRSCQMPALRHRLHHRVDMLPILRLLCTS